MQTKKRKMKAGEALVGDEEEEPAAMRQCIQRCMPGDARSGDSPAQTEHDRRGCGCDGAVEERFAWCKILTVDAGADADDRRVREATSLAAEDTSDDGASTRRGAAPGQAQTRDSRVRGAEGRFGIFAESERNAERYGQGRELAGDRE